MMLHGDKMEIRQKGNSLICSIQNFTVVDIETTGLSPKTNHIIEIGAVKYTNNMIRDTFQMLVKPPKIHGEYVSKEIENITGITNGMLNNANDMHFVLFEFLQFLGSDIIVGHNVNFDINFLYDASERLSFRRLNNDFIDTMKLGRSYLKDLDHHTLKDVSEYFGIKNIRAHRALNDCLTTGACYLKFQKYIESLNTV